MVKKHTTIIILTCLMVTFGTPLYCSLPKDSIPKQSESPYSLTPHQGFYVTEEAFEELAKQYLALAQATPSGTPRPASNQVIQLPAIAQPEANSARTPSFRGAIERNVSASMSKSGLPVPAQFNQSGRAISSKKTPSNTSTDPEQQNVINRSLSSGTQTFALVRLGGSYKAPDTSASGGQAITPKQDDATSARHSSAKIQAAHLTNQAAQLSNDILIALSKHQGHAQYLARQNQQHAQVDPKALAYVVSSFAASALPTNNGQQIPVPAGLAELNHTPVAYSPRTIAAKQPEHSVSVTQLPPATANGDLAPEIAPSARPAWQQARPATPHHTDNTAPGQTILYPMQQNINRPVTCNLFCAIL